MLDIEERTIEYWKGEARHASGLYIKAARSLRQFLWATVILGVLSSLLTTALVIVWRAKCGGF